MSKISIFLDLTLYFNDLKMNEKHILLSTVCYHSCTIIYFLLPLLHHYLLSVSTLAPLSTVCYHSCTIIYYLLPLLHHYLLSVTTVAPLSEFIILELMQFYVLIQLFVLDKFKLLFLTISYIDNHTI